MYYIIVLSFLAIRKMCFCQKFKSHLVQIVSFNDGDVRRKALRDPNGYAGRAVRGLTAP